MNKPIRPTLILFFLLLACDISLVASTPDGAEWMEQPILKPGNWAVMDVELPPLTTPRHLNGNDRPVYGLYSWEHEYLQHNDFIQKVGWKNFRLSGPINDRVMAQYAKDGVEVMYTLTTREPFATPDHPSGKWRNRKHYPTDEAFVEAYVGDLRKVLERYGPRGTFFKENPDIPYRPLLYFEVYNEPNLFYMDQDRLDHSARAMPKDPDERAALLRRRGEIYFKLLKASYSAIKADWPEVSVVAFSACGVMHLDIPFLEEIFRFNKDIANYFDIMSVHPYNRPGPPDGYSVHSTFRYSPITSFIKYAGFMERRGAGHKPIWWTEWGWTISKEAGGSYGVKDETGGGAQDRDVSPELQAAFYVRGYMTALRLGVARLHFMSIVDTDGFNSGMLGGANNKEWRPLAQAIKNLIELMPHPRLLAAPIDNKDGLNVYELESRPGANQGKPDRIMIWNVGGPRTVELDWKDKESVTIIDMVGNRSKLNPEKGKLAVPAGPLPVYLLPLESTSGN